ncbi:hypothetical protein QE152_g24601 [Popillia japonica]|uniref:EGF-like domain-containing protein n=1 Tax=Popillia japonica TaxID=7064 RepID=A0AAW1K6W6_POPJA
MKSTKKGNNSIGARCLLTVPILVDDALISAPSIDRPSDSSERIPILRTGSCHKGICGQEAACKPYENNTYTCLCPHDSAPPTKDRKCPTRYTVDLTPSIIQNIRPPPVENITSVKNVSTNNTIRELGKTEESTLSSTSLPNQNVIIASVTCTAVVLLVIIIWLKRKYCSGNHKNSTSPSPIALKRNFLVADRYAPNPQYSTCPSTAVPILKRETLKFISEIGEGCFGKVFKDSALCIRIRVNVIRVRHKPGPSDGMSEFEL